MGLKGWTCCILTAPASIAGPLPISPVFMAFSHFWRSELVELNNVEDGTANESFWKGILYPCSLLQIFISLKEWEDDGTQFESITDIIKVSANKHTVEI